MSEKKDQFVIAYLPHLDHTQAVVSHALALARIIKKGLILLHISDPKYTSVSPSEAETQMRLLRDELLSAQPDIQDISYAALQGETKPIIDALPTLLNAVVCVAEVDADAKRKTPLHKKELLRNFAECKVAFLTVQDPLTEATAYADVDLSIDFKRESKEKIIWSSYFARFNNSRLHIISPEYKDTGLHQKWTNNMRFIRKLFDNLGITFTLHPINERTTYTDQAALNESARLGHRLFIAVTTKEKDGLEMIMGVQEDRTIVNRYRIPILFLNPRKDIYILCD
mgnify:CR=1 FL=1